MRQAGHGRSMLAFRSVVSVLVRFVDASYFGQGGRGGGWWACEVVVDLAGDVALQPAHDVELGQALVGPLLDIDPGRWVAVHADQGDAPQGMVGSAVAAAIASVAVGAARGRRDGSGAAQVREGSLGAQPLGLSPAVTSSCPAVSTRLRAARPARAAAATSSWSWRSSRSSSAWSCCQRRARVHRVALVAAVGLVKGPGRIAAQALTRALVLPPSRGCAARWERWRARHTAARRLPPWP